MILPHPRTETPFNLLRLKVSKSPRGQHEWPLLSPLYLAPVSLQEETLTSFALDLRESGVIASSLPPSHHLLFCKSWGLINAFVLLLFNFSHWSCGWGQVFSSLTQAEDCGASTLGILCTTKGCIVCWLIGTQQQQSSGVQEQGMIL